MLMIKFIFDSYGTPILIGLFIILFIVETKFQLRKRVQDRWKKIVINFIVSIPAFVHGKINDKIGVEFFRSSFFDFQLNL